MAWIFELSVECGPSQSSARAVADHFGSWPSDVRQGGGFTGSVLVDGTRCDPWWVHVVPDGVGRSGVTSAEVAVAMTAVGYRLYDHLRSAASVYRYALVGVEVEEFRQYEELCDEPDLRIFPGLVLADSLWRTLGRPAGFEAFAPGYLWLPYQGEEYTR